MFPWVGNWASKFALPVADLHRNTTENIHNKFFRNYWSDFVSGVAWKFSSRGETFQGGGAKCILFQCQDGARGAIDPPCSPCSYSTGFCSNLAQMFFRVGGCFTASYKDVRQRWKQTEKSDLLCAHVRKKKEHWQFQLDSPANHLQSNRNRNAPFLIGEHAQFADPIDSLQLNIL